jgi:RNA-directed DNA polymerase
MNAGIMDGGVVIERHEGTPQGGLLSPLLANVLLDEVDLELERCGHCFVRYADGCNVYVRSRRAGEPVMALLRRLYAKLKLKINQAKSAVANAFGRKFLGYAFWATSNGQVRRAVAAKPLATFKQRVRQMTGRSGGRSMAQVIQKLRTCICLVGKPTSDCRRHPKCGVSWTNGRGGDCVLCNSSNGAQARGPIGNCRDLGPPPQVARSVAALSGRWWHNSVSAIHQVLGIAHFDSLGLPRLA